MMKRILGYIIVLVGVLAIAFSLLLLRELVPGVEECMVAIDLMLLFLEIDIILAGIIAAIYGYVRWRKIPDSETAEWYRQFKGRREMARCPRCESLNIDFEKSSPVPSAETGKMKWKAVCYDCGKTWEIEK